MKILKFILYLLCSVNLISCFSIGSVSANPIQTNQNRDSVSLVIEPATAVNNLANPRQYYGNEVETKLFVFLSLDENSNLVPEFAAEMANIDMFI